MDNSFLIPAGLTPEFVAERLRCNGGLTKLNELANRGIILNTWQANHFLLDGDRQVGKTYLAFVVIAEKFKDSGARFTEDSDLKIFDNDVTSWHDHIEFLKGLKLFISEFYSDIYTVTEHTAMTLNIELRTTSKIRWWNI